MSAEQKSRSEKKSGNFCAAKHFSSKKTLPKTYPRPRCWTACRLEQLFHDTVDTGWSGADDLDVRLCGCRAEHYSYQVDGYKYTTAGEYNDK